MSDAMVFVCPACDRVSHHPEDVANGYCAACRWWTGDPRLAWQHPDLFSANGKPCPAKPGPGA